MYFQMVTINHISIGNYLFDLMELYNYFYNGLVNYFSD